jgi:acylphosphatase
MRKALKLRIYGTVQGVGFRFFARDVATKLELMGFVRNERDGSVHAEAEGEEKSLQKFLEWCRKGPPFANVEKIEFSFSEAEGKYVEFRIE